MNVEPELSELLSEFARTLLTDYPGQSILDRLVVRIVEVLPVSAAGVTLRTPDSDAVYIAASDHRALRLEQLQSEIGEGPSRLVFASGTALSISDVTTEKRLQTFGPRVVDSGFRAMFTFPLREGATPLGTLDLYAENAGPLEPRHLEIAQTLADVAAAYTINATARGDLMDAAAAALFMSGSVGENIGARPRLMATDLALLQKPFGAAALGAAVAAALRSRVVGGFTGGITPTATPSGEHTR